MVRPPRGNADVRLYRKDGTIFFSVNVPSTYSWPMETVRIDLARAFTRTALKQDISH